MIQDCHIHTAFSPDGKSTPEEVLRKANEKGLSYVIFTEHCECNGNAPLPPTETPWESLDVKAYTEKLLSLRENPPVSFGIGVEIGQALQGKETSEKYINAYDWDFIINSLHNVKGKLDFCFLDYGKEDIKAIFHQYFSELYEAAKLDFYSVLGHLYYPARYLYRQNADFNIGDYDEEIREILKVVIENGKGIEINTKGLYEKIHRPIPELRHLKMYRELGGEIITIGSDSHTPDTVGKGVDEATEILKEAGFRAVAYFRKRKPEFRDL